MTSETIPCPRCSRPTPPELDACEHCGDSIVTTTESGDAVARGLLRSVGIGAAGLAIAGASYAAYLGWIDSPDAVRVVPPTVAWLVIGAVCLAAYYRRDESDPADDA